MEARKLDNLTVLEYIAIEIEAQQRYEYHDGAIYAMSGGTLNHGWISGNVFGELRERLKANGGDCRVMNSEIKLHLKASNSYVYPDAMVVCGEVIESHSEAHAVTNPKVIIEVLSKSTALYDRADKFYLYQQIPSLEEYILIEQDKPQVETFKRNGEAWNIKRITGLDAILFIEPLHISMPFEEIYQDIVFQ